MVGARLLAGPVLLLMAATHHIGAAFLAILVGAVISDIIDGMIARRLGTSTPLLRRLDGYADIALYASLAGGVWLIHREAVVAFALPLALLLAGQITLYAFSLARFRVTPSYHGVTAKAWGLGLAVAFVMVFYSDRTAAAFWIALVLGYLNTLDEIATTAVLPHAQTDVLTLAKAFAIRRNAEGRRS